MGLDLVSASMGMPVSSRFQYTDARRRWTPPAGKLATHLGDGNHVALLNNLGGTSVLEMAVLANELANSEISAQFEVDCRAGRNGDVAGHARLLGVGLSGHTRGH